MAAEFSFLAVFAAFIYFIILLTLLKGVEDFTHTHTQKREETFKLEGMHAILQIIIHNLSGLFSKVRLE